MKANYVVTAVFLFAMILGSPVDARSSTFAVAAANSKPLHASKLTFNFCAVSVCRFFYNNRVCYCCPDASRKENCHTGRVQGKLCLLHTQMLGSDD